MFRSNDGGICGLRGGARLDVHSFAGGTLSSGLEGALVSVSGSEVVLDDRHYNRHTSLFRHGDSGINNSGNSVASSGIEGNAYGSRFHARMDDRFDDRPSYQRGGGSVAGQPVSPCHARIGDGLDDFPSSQRGGSGAGFGGSRFHARMDDCFVDRPSFQRGGSGAGSGGLRFHARMDDRSDDHPSSQRGGSGAELGGSRCHARMGDCFDCFPSSHRGAGFRPRHVGSGFLARTDVQFDDRPSSQSQSSCAGLGCSGTVACNDDCFDEHRPSLFGARLNVRTDRHLADPFHDSSYKRVGSISPVLEGGSSYHSSRIDDDFDRRPSSYFHGDVRGNNLGSRFVSGLDNRFDERLSYPNANLVGGEVFHSRSSVLDPRNRNYDDHHFSESSNYNANQAGNGHSSFDPPSSSLRGSCSDAHEHISGRGLPVGQPFLPCSTVVDCRPVCSFWKKRS
jgi:hypothetical protein